MKLLYTGLLAGLAACAPLAPGASAQDAATVTVEQAWIHAAPKGQFETWAFATIVNAGKADALVAANSPDTGSIVLRAATITDAGTKMRTVAAIPVPAQGRLVLSADTYCLAFIEARHAFAAGQPLTATLTFSSGARVPVTFTVSEAEGDPKDRGN